MEKTAIDLENKYKIKYKDMISNEVRCFKKWSIGKEDVEGKLHTIYTKAPYIFKEEISSCKEEIDNLISQEIISRFYGMPRHVIPWFSVSKKNTTKRRIVLDFRALNKLTERAPSLPLNRECVIQDLACKNYYSKFDITSGFYQLKLKDDLRTYFTIMIDNKLYAFNRLPMGWVNSMAYFDQAIRHTLDKVRDELEEKKLNTVIGNFVDDLCIGSENLHDHIIGMDILFKHLNDDGWSLSPDKMIWLSKEINFLGYTFSEKGILPDYDIRNKIEKLQAPSNKKELRSCIGLIRLLLNHCQVRYEDIRNLYELLNKSTKEIENFWKKNVMKWEQLKKSLNKCFYTQPNKISDKVEMYVDACKIGYGYALFDGKSKSLITLGSGSFKHDNFSSSGKAEMEGLKKALKACRHYIIGKEITIYTDATVVRQGNNQKNISLLTQNYMETLNLTAGKLVHLDGVQNKIADILSRSQYWKKVCNQSYTVEENIMTNKENFDWYKVVQEYIENKEHVEITETQKNLLESKIKRFRIHENDLQYQNSDGNWVKAINRIDKNKYLTAAHEEQGHYGIDQTERKLRLMAYWPEINTDVKLWVRSCDSCQRHQRKDTKNVIRNMTWIQPNEMVGLDFIGPVPCVGTKKYILTIVDHCTKWCKLIPTVNAEAKVIVAALNEWSSEMGLPSCILTDNAKNFNSKLIDNWCEEFQVRRRMIPGYMPQCNGTTERMNQEVLKRIRNSKGGKDWPRRINMIQFQLRTCPNRFTNLSAFQMLMGFQPRGHGLQEPRTNLIEPNEMQQGHLHYERITEFRTNGIIKAVNKRNKFQEQNSTKMKNFNINDYILIWDGALEKQHHKKFNEQWLGPFKIIKQKSPVIYIIQKSNKQIMVHKNNMKLYYNRKDFFNAQGSDCGQDRI